MGMISSNNWIYWGCEGFLVSHYKWAGFVQATITVSAYRESKKSKNWLMNYISAGKRGNLPDVKIGSIIRQNDVDDF